MEVSKKKKTKDFIIDMLWITFGTFIAGTAMFFFMVPSNLAVSSITGVAIMLAHFLPFRVSLIMFVLNMICLVLGFLFVGKEFSGKTIWTSIFEPAVMAMWEVLFPHYKSVMGGPFVDLICYIFLVSLGLAIVFNHNASTGGIDIIVKIMNKYLHMELGRAMSIAGLVVSVPSFFIFGPRIGVLSILGSYLSGIVLDHFIFGFTQKKKVCILSNKYREIADYIVNDMHSGATFYDIRGAYNNEKRTEIEAIVDRSEYSVLMNYILQEDPSAFVTVYNVSESRIRPKPVVNRKQIEKQTEE